MISFYDQLTDKPLNVELTEVIIAGWAGREQSGIDAHIAELRELGVTPPSRTPLFYRVSADRVTTDPVIQVLSEHTSGEAEVVLIGTEDGTYVGIGSDHTDRAAEAWSVAHSKQVCAKPVGAGVWPLEAVLAHWDELVLAAHTVDAGEERLYQHGTVDGLLHPETLLREFGLDIPSLAPGQVMFCGTLPVIDGDVRPAEALSVSLRDPVSDRQLVHRYRVETLPVVA